MTIETFTASNGVWVVQDAYKTDRGHALLVDGSRVGPNDAQALREYFLAERDKELGRWRDPENPDQVIYPSHTNVVHVLDESTGRVGVWSRFEEDNAFTGDRSGEAAAKRYFEENPLKPWRDAKPGEVWRLTYRTPSAKEISNPVMTCVMDGTNVSFFNEWRLHTVHYTGIESAERIWPES